MKYQLIERIGFYAIENEAGEVIRITRAANEDDHAFKQRAIRRFNEYVKSLRNLKSKIFMNKVIATEIV